MIPNDFRSGVAPVIPAFPPPPTAASSGDTTKQPYGASSSLWVATRQHSQRAVGAGESGGGAVVESYTNIVPPPLGEKTLAQPNEHKSKDTREAQDYSAYRLVQRMLVEQDTGTEGGIPMEGAATAVSSGEYEEYLEFVTGSPRHVLSISSLLALGLFGAIPLMSAFALSVLLTGCVVSYAVDFAGYRRGGVFAVVLTALSFGLALFLSNLHSSLLNMGPLCMILSMQGLLMCATMASLLHFHWLQLNYPGLICLMERCIVSVTPMFTLPLLFSTIAAFVGSRHAPAWFLASMCILHRLFYQPIESSFISQCRRRRARQGGSDDFAGRDIIWGVGAGSVVDDEVKPLQVNGRPEAITFTLLLLFLPTTIYISLQNNWREAWIANLINAAGMICAPLLYICWDPVKSLWFLRPEDKAGRGHLEYDPLGIQKIVSKYRKLILALSILVIPNWFVYRLLSSRFRFLFNGLAPPYNGLCVSAAMYTGIFSALQIKMLLDADRQQHDMLRPDLLKLRGLAAFAATASGILLGLATGMPGPFIFLLIFCVFSVNIFLLDRTNEWPMMSFTVFSSLLLMWWMHRMYSFIIVDLHVLGESATVSTAFLTLGVAWCYMLSCMAFTASFSKFKTTFVILMFLHSTKVAWIEHVLYSQKEEGVYPAVLVLLTSVAGVLLSVRLYRNGVLGANTAAFIAASYVAKLPTFLVEVTGSYYSADSLDESEAQRRGIEIGVVWWAALFYGYAVTIFELCRGTQMRASSAKWLFTLFLSSSVALVACTARNFQLALYDFLVQRRLFEKAMLPVTLGTCLSSYSFLTYPFILRRKTEYSFVETWLVVSRCTLILGIVLLLLQSVRVSDDQIRKNLGVENSDLGNYSAMVGLLLIIAGRYITFSSVHFTFRAMYWMSITCCLSLFLTIYLLPVPTFLVLIGVCGFVFFTLLNLDMAHYREQIFSTGCTIYAVSVCFMIYTFVVLSRLSVDEELHDDPVFLWELNIEGRKRLLSVIAVTSLFTAIVLRFRLNGKALLPDAIPLPHAVAEYLRVIINYSATICVASMTVLNMWCNDYEPGLHVTTSPLLLLLVDDGLVFTGLGTKRFRYFPPLLYAVTLLWVSYINDAYAVGQTVTDGIKQVLLNAVYAFPVIPSQLSLLFLLWFGRKSAGTPLAAVLVFVVLDVFVLLLSSNKTLQWMAIVGICGQCARLLEAQLLQERMMSVFL
ncbi:hypothetical protein TRVL_01395 [Trypanosoma vivax]|nr:hypothetical protein TRVL_01395 [Trypanosoma vivax]